MSIAEDIVRVQEALGTAAEAGDLSGGPDAFERIVTRLRALEEEVAVHLASDECREPVRIELSE